MNHHLITHQIQLLHHPIKPEGPLFVDLETYGDGERGALNTRTNTIRLVTIADDTSPPLVIDCHHVPVGEAIALLQGRELVGHNLAFDLPILIRHGLQQPPKVKDTMLASQVLMCGTQDTHKLGDCVFRYLGEEIDKSKGKENWGMAVLPQDMLDYAATDVAKLRELLERLTAHLEEQKLLQVFELECDFLLPLVAMSTTGVRIDIEHWRKRSIDAAGKAQTIEDEILEAMPPVDPKPLKTVRVSPKTGQPNATDLKTNARIAAKNKEIKWNLGSPKQLLMVFQRLGVDLPDTSYETLVEMRTEHELLDKLVEYRLWKKQSEAFGEDWLKNIEPNDDHVYPWWRQMGTRQGRMSCADPNLQQTPRGACRKGIIAEPGCVLVRADYSQIEARVAAKVSGDPTLTKLFIDGKQDIHIFTSSRVLEKLESSITKDERQLGKSLLFGLLFGMQAKNLRVYCRTQYGVSMTLEEAEVFRDKFFQIFPGLADWHAESRKRSKYKCDFRTLTGRRRWVPDDADVNRQGISLNLPVQGTAADLLKMAVIEMWRRRSEFPEYRLSALIHDEIMGSVPIGLEHAAAAWLKGIMIEVGNKLIDPIPVDAEVKIGPTWGG